MKNQNFRISSLKFGVSLCHAFLYVTDVFLVVQTVLIFDIIKKVDGNRHELSFARPVGW